MSSVLAFVLALLGGVLLGVVFFGGLWWTVIRGVSSPRPALWFFGSMLLRTSVTLAGFYFVGREDWQRWLLCLLGFVLARLVAWWLTCSSGADHTRPIREVSYAP